MKVKKHTHAHARENPLSRFPQEGKATPFVRGLVAEDKNRGKNLSVAFVLLVILVLLTYSGAVHNNFVSWDDYDYVIDNELVRKDGPPDLKAIFSTVVSLNYHPLTILSLSLNSNDCRKCPEGISARPFITGNIILHTLNTLLVFILIWLLFRKDLIIAFIVAAIFAVHPMHVESVAWVSARKDLLSSFFFLSGLISWIMYLNNSGQKYLWLLFSFLLFCLATLSKATTVVFPLIAILIWYLIDCNQGSVNSKMLLKNFSSRVIIPLIPFFAVSIFTGLMAINVQNGENFLGMFQFSRDPEDAVNTAGDFSLFQRTGIACHGFFVYMIKFFLPVKLSAFYPYPAPEELSRGLMPLLFFISFLAFILVIVLSALSIKKTNLFMFCFGFYLLNLVLVLHFVSVGKAMLAERYTYLPYIGLAILPAWYISRSKLKTKRILLFISGAFIIMLLLLAKRQVEVWHDTESLWTQVIEKHPSQELARSARGKHYYRLASLSTDKNERKNLEEKALADFRVAISQNTTRAEVYEYTGVIMLTRDDLKSALQLIDISIKLDPLKGRAYFNRAIVYDQMNMKEEAIRDYNMALKTEPGMAPEILRNRSVLYLETQKYESALKDLDSLVKTDGNDFSNYYNRAFAKVMLKDYKGAIEDYRSALKLNPGDKQTMEHLRVLSESQNTK